MRSVPANICVASPSARAVLFYSLPPMEMKMLRKSYRCAQENFADLYDEVTKNREIVIIGPRNGEKVAMIAADELESLLEMAHLMRSPKNAQRLLTSLQRALT